MSQVSKKHTSIGCIMIVHIFTYMGCGKDIKHPLSLHSECNAPEYKIKGNAVYVCRSNLGVSSWYKDYSCENPDFPPVILDHPDERYTWGATTCMDTNGNIEIPKDYSAEILCREQDHEQWRYVTGWSYDPKKEENYTLLKNNYWYKCDPSRTFPDPGLSEDSYKEWYRYEYIECDKNEVLDTSTSTPSCSAEG